MTSKAERLGKGVSFGSAERVSARRAAIAAATGAPTQGVEPRHLPLKLISLNPDNPRDELTKIREMAGTFESVGQITAITIGTREAYLRERPDRPTISSRAPITSSSMATGGCRPPGCSGGRPCRRSSSTTPWSPPTSNSWRPRSSPTPSART